MQLSAPMVENVCAFVNFSERGRVAFGMLGDLKQFPPEHATIIDRIGSYWGRYNQPPGLQLPALLDDILNRPARDERRAIFIHIIDNIIRLGESLNEDYILTRLSNTVRLQAIRSTVLSVADRLQREDDATVPEAEAMLGELLRARTMEFDPGLTLQDVPGFVASLDRRAGIPLGIGPLDQLNILPKRGTLFMLLGVTGVGKTWFLVHCGIRALRQRLRVVHVSLEIVGPDVLGRYYQGLFGLTERETVEKIPNFLFSEGGKMGGLTWEAPNPPFAFRGDHGEVTSGLAGKLHGQLAQLGRAADYLRIRSWPPHVVTIGNLEAYLDTLIDVHGFAPDVLLVDYPKLMKLKPDKDSFRLELGHVVEGIRRIAIERNLAAVIVHQGTREAAKSKVVDYTHVSEDWSVAQTVDTLVTYSATPSELKFGLARLLVDKVRGPGKGRCMVITQNYPSGQFATQAIPLPDGYMDYIERQKQQQDESAAS